MYPRRSGVGVRGEGGCDGRLTCRGTSEIRCAEQYASTAREIVCGRTQEVSHQAFK